MQRMMDASWLHDSFAVGTLLVVSRNSAGFCYQPVIVPKESTLGLVNTSYQPLLGVLQYQAFHWSIVGRVLPESYDGWIQWCAVTFLLYNNTVPHNIGWRWSTIHVSLGRGAVCTELFALQIRRMDLEERPWRWQGCSVRPLAIWQSKVRWLSWRREANRFCNSNWYIGIPVRDHRFVTILKIHTIQADFKKN